MKSKRYSVQAVARLTGLTPDTLRAWERRYGAVVPGREGKGRRAYSDSDVERLLLLKQVCDVGHAIRLVAPLNNDQLREIIATGPRAVEAASTSKDIVARLLSEVDRFALREFEQELGRALVSLDMRRAIVEILEPLLKGVGDRWERGELSIAQEHAVSSSLRNFMGGMARAYPRRNGRFSVVLTTLSGELHEFGALMLYLLAVSEGFGCHYLGPNLPPEEIARTLRVTGSRVVGLSIVNRERAEDTAEQLRTLCALLEDTDMEVWIGGPGAQEVASHVRDLGIEHVVDLDDYYRRLSLLRIH